MKKLVLLLGAVTLTAGNLFAAVDQKQLDGAVMEYQRSMVENFCVGFRIHKIAVTPALKEQIARLSGAFIRDTVLPALKKHRLEETWVKCVSDPELRALQLQTQKINDEKELRRTIEAIIKLMNEKYPILVNTVFADPEYQAGFKKLVDDLRVQINIPAKTK